MPRCSFTNCKRKLPLTVTTCRCNLLFCDIHRMPEEHSCVYDYKTEGKDGLAHPDKPLMKVLEENLMREIEEESKIQNVFRMKHTGLVLQSREKEYPENTYFQYHVFQAFIDADEFEKAKQKFAWYKEHPKAFNRLRKDNREKDEIDWYNPSKTKMYGRWSPSIVAMYLNSFR